MSLANHTSCRGRLRPGFSRLQRPDVVHNRCSLELALEALSRDDESLARIIEMKYFRGMTAEDMAEALGPCGAS